MAFVSDTFTDTEKDLNAHTGETGATWARNSAASGNDIVVSNANRVRSGTAPSGTYYASGSPAAAEYDVTADIYVANLTGVGGTGSHAYVLGRESTSAITFYALQVDINTTGVVKLQKAVADSYTDLGTWTISPAPSATDVLACTLEIRDATKKAYINGTERASSTDNVITAAGKAGVRFDRASSNTEALHIDNFVASDPVVPPTDGPALRFMRHPLRGI